MDSSNIHKRSQSELLVRDPAQADQEGQDSPLPLALRLQRQQEAAYRQMQEVESPEKLHKNSPKIINPKNILYSNQRMSS